MSTPRTALERIAATQAGLFTRRQALSGGYSAYQIRHRVASGLWQPVLGPVLALSGRHITPLVRDRAASLAVPTAVPAGPSAARRFGIDVTDSGTWLIAHPSQRIRLPNVRVHRELLPERDIAWVDGLLITVRDRTVFDCLRWLPESSADQLLDRALQRKWIDLPALVTRVHDFAGRPGIRRLIRLVNNAAPGARSAAAHHLHSHLRRAGISGWHANAPIHARNGDLIGEGDVVFPALRLVIEVDGRAWHSSDDRFQHDRSRQNRLVAEGWTVLRFTWHDLTERPASVVDTIKRVSRLLAARSA